MKSIKDLIGYFVTNCKYEINRTTIVKMCYLFEYYHTKTFGAQLTDAKFIRFNYGPYSQTLKSSLTQMVNDDLLLRRTSQYNEKTIHYYYSNGISFDLEQYQVDIANYVLLKLASKSYQDMIDYVYDTPPMKTILDDENVLGHRLDGSDLDMTKSKPIFKPTKSQMAKAKKTQLSQKSRGSDEDYALCALQEAAETEYMRERVMVCQEG